MPFQTHIREEIRQLIIQTNDEEGTVGPPGPQGDPGTPGTNGTNGNNGNDGAAGATGDTGLTGPTGDTGATGEDGLDGATVEEVIDSDQFKNLIQTAIQNTQYLQTQNGAGFYPVHPPSIGM